LTKPQNRRLQQHQAPKALGYHKAHQQQQLLLQLAAVCGPGAPWQAKAAAQQQYQQVMVRAVKMLQTLIWLAGVT
jgi:hypothetical protein